MCFEQRFILGGDLRLSFYQFMIEINFKVTYEFIMKTFSSGYLKVNRKLEAVLLACSVSTPAASFVALDMFSKPYCIFSS